MDDAGFGRIRSKGDQALFGGRSTQEMKEKLGVSYKRPLADFLPTLTTIHQESSLRAKTAIRCLEAMRDGAECKKEIVLPVELIKRESTRKL